MNWYKKAQAQRIVLPSNIYDQLEELAVKISRGHRHWTTEDFQLQQNYSEALECFLRKIQEKNI